MANVEVLCPACAVERICAESYRVEGPDPDDSRGYDFAWCMGAAHVAALVQASKPAVLTLCEEHQREYDELVDEGVASLDRETQRHRVLSS